MTFAKQAQEMHTAAMANAETMPLALRQQLARLVEEAMATGWSLQQFQQEAEKLRGGLAPRCDTTTQTGHTMHTSRDGLLLQLHFPGDRALNDIVAVAQRLVTDLRASGISCHISADQTGVRDAYATKLNELVGGIDLKYLRQ